MTIRAAPGVTCPPGEGLEETARVVAVFSTGAWIETEAKGGCGGCHARQGCGTGILSRRTRQPRLALYTRERLQVGDRIRVGMPAKHFLGGAVIVYAWPLVLAILSGLLAETLMSPQHIAVPLAFGGGLALGVMLSRAHLQRHQHRYRPYLVAIDTSETDKTATFSRTC